MEILNVYPFSLLWKIVLLVLYGAGMYSTIQDAVKDYSSKGFKGIIDEIIKMIIMTGLIIYLLFSPPTILFELVGLVIGEIIKALYGFVKYVISLG